MSGGTMQSFDFKIVLECPLKTVFAIYTDIDRWQNRSLFGEIRWVQGKPWEEGSRLTYRNPRPGSQHNRPGGPAFFRERERELPEPCIRHYL